MPYADRALELDPHRSDNHALLAHIFVGLKKWGRALESAEHGLALDRTDEVCANLRAVALRHTEGIETFDTELKKLTLQYPANDWIRSAQGWGALAEGQPIEAQQHFEQALILDPTSELAREGLIEAVKAENPIYRRVLGVFLWMDRLPTRTRWFIILGGLFSYRYLRDLSEAVPAVAPVAYPLMAVWLLFVLLSWTSGPLSDFVLSRTERGRDLISGERLLAARLLAGLLGSAVLFAIAAAVTSFDRLTAAAMVTALLVIPTAAVFQCLPGWPRSTMAVYAGLAGLAGLAAVFAPSPADWTAFLISIFMSVLGSWLGVFLAGRRPKT